MQKVLLIIINLVTLNHLSAQTITVNELINKVDSAYSQVENMSYLIDYRMKSFMEEEAYNNRAIVSIKRQEEDSLKIYFNLYSISENFQAFYNGENIIYNYFKHSITEIINNEFHKAIGQYIYSNFVGEVVFIDFFQKGYFRAFLDNPDVQDMKYEEQEFQGIPTYKLSILYPTNEEVSKMEDNYFIDKETFFVIGFTSSGFFEDVYEERKECLLHNININQNFADTFWTVDYHLNMDFKTEFITPGEKKSAPLLESGSLAPEIEAKKLDGNTFNLSNYRGKIVFLDFWYQSCYPCLKLMDDLKILADEFPSDKFEIIGVNNIDSKEKMTAFLDRKKVKYTNIYDCKDAIADYKISAYPALYIIDEDGKIIEAIAGWSDGLIEELREVLETELK